MQLTFEMDSDSKAITVAELNNFETMVGLSLPQDYCQHMLTYNGGALDEDVDHINYIGGGQGISYFYPIKYGYDKMEDVFNDLSGTIPNGYLAIGKTDGGGQILISLNSGSTYGKTIEWYPDGTINDLSPSFTQLLNDMVESNE